MNHGYGVKLPAGRRVTMGKCKRCNRVYVWWKGADRRLGSTRCVTCNGTLEQTSRQATRSAWYSLDADMPGFTWVGSRDDTVYPAWPFNGRVGRAMVPESVCRR